MDPRFQVARQVILTDEFLDDIRARAHAKEADLYQRFTGKDLADKMRQEEFRGFLPRYHAGGWCSKPVWDGCGSWGWV